MNPPTPDAPADLKSILLVEDDRLDVSLILAALASEGLARKIRVVNDGAEALDYLYRHGKYDGREFPHPCLILLDDKMTGMEVLAVLKGDEDLRTTPVVVLTFSREGSDLAVYWTTINKTLGMGRAGLERLGMA